jgi:DNA (cytosine-5)-methyltransferase 1
MTQNGQAYELPTPEHHTTDSESSSLPTPTVSDQYTANLTSTQQSEGSLHSVTLAQIVNRADLLPTPNTMEHREIKTPEQIAELKKKSPGGYRNLREEVINYLPTPQTGDGLKGMTSTPEHRIATGHQVMLSNHAPQLTNTWGRFEPAIRRWESVLGRPAPAPTNPDGKDGNHRLSSKFTEWMMGLPDGWITDAGLTRNEELKACGNGVVPQQAELALRMLLK